METEASTTLRIPTRSLVVTCGASASGKSTYLNSLVEPIHVISADAVRGLIADDFRHKSVSRAAHDVLYALVRLRMEFGRPVIVDGSFLDRSRRRRLLSLAYEFAYRPYLLIFPIAVEELRLRLSSRSKGDSIASAETQLERYRQAVDSANREDWYQIVSAEKITPSDIRIVRNLVPESFDVLAHPRGRSDAVVRLIDKVRAIDASQDRPTRKLFVVGDLCGPSTTDNVFLLEQMAMLFEEGVLQALYSAADGKWLTGVSDDTRLHSAGESISVPLRHLLLGSDLFVTSEDSHVIVASTKEIAESAAARTARSPVLIYADDSLPRQISTRRINIPASSSKLSLLRYPERKLIEISPRGGSM